MFYIESCFTAQKNVKHRGRTILERDAPSGGPAMEASGTVRGGADAGVASPAEPPPHPGGVPVRNRAGGSGRRRCLARRATASPGWRPCQDQRSDAHSATPPCCLSRTSSEPPTTTATVSGSPSRSTTTSLSTTRPRSASDDCHDPLRPRTRRHRTAKPPSHPARHVRRLRLGRRRRRPPRRVGRPRGHDHPNPDPSAASPTRVPHPRP
jgi:hypothetical protein